MLGRNLAVVALKSELAAQLARRGRPEAVDHMEEVQRIAQESQRRDPLGGPRLPHRRPATPNSPEHAPSWRPRASTAASVRPAGRLPTDVQSALGWVVREATTNVLRHAQGASRCTMSLRTAGPTTALLVMENDGASEAEPGTGTGLAGLKERLGALNGTLAFEQHSGGVFRLTASIPWEEAE